MSRRPMPRSGFTLIEALLALGIGMLLIGACYELMRRARSSAEEGLTGGRLDLEANDLIHRVADLLRQSSVSSPDWDLAEDGSSLTYNLCEGASGGTLLWSDPLVLSAFPNEGDLGAEGDDGVDNDGDGLVDERTLAILEAGTGIERESWAVHLQAFRITQDGKTLQVTLTLQTLPSETGGPPETASASTSVFTRN